MRRGQIGHVRRAGGWTPRHGRLPARREFCTTSALASTLTPDLASGLADGLAGGLAGARTFS